MARGNTNIYNNKYKALYLEIPAIGLSSALGVWGKRQ